MCSQKKNGSCWLFGLRISFAYGVSRASVRESSERDYTFSGSRAVPNASLLTSVATHNWRR